MKKSLSNGLLVGCLMITWLVPSVWAQAIPTAATSTPVASLESLAEGNNAFGMDLFHRLGQSVANDKNLVFSPYSISTALAMAWTGARNNTAAQMEQVLHLTGDQQTIGDGFHQMRDSLENAGKNGGFDLSIANSLWLQNDYPFLQPFLDGLKNDFNAPPNLVNFKTGVEAVRGQINQWVEDKTHQKIKDLIPSGALDPRVTRMVLVNAVYFKADWQNAFKPEVTQQLPFHYSADNSAPVSMMAQQQYFQIAEDDRTQVLELPYKGNQFSMVVILPKDEMDLPALEQNLNLDTLNTWLSKMCSKEVQVKLPKFKFTYGTVYLNAFLSKMGITDAFNEQVADFSGMIAPEQEHLHISQVVHKAFVNVDEKGTEAAAATSVIMAIPLCMPMNPRPLPIVFNADHPFLFLIRDNQTHSILFIGRVADPRAES